MVKSAGSAELDRASPVRPTGSIRPAKLDSAGAARPVDTFRPEGAGQSRFRDSMVRMRIASTEGNRIIEDE